MTALRKSGRGWKSNRATRGRNIGNPSSSQNPPENGPTDGFSVAADCAQQEILGVIREEQDVPLASDLETALNSKDLVDCSPGQNTPEDSQILDAVKNNSEENICIGKDEHHSFEIMDEGDAFNRNRDVGETRNCEEREHTDGSCEPQLGDNVKEIGFEDTTDIDVANMDLENMTADDLHSTGGGGSEDTVELPNLGDSGFENTLEENVVPHCSRTSGATLYAVQTVEDNSQQERGEIKSNDVSSLGGSSNTEELLSEVEDEANTCNYQCVENCVHVCIKADTSPVEFDPSETVVPRSPNMAYCKSSLCDENPEIYLSKSGHEAFSRKDINDVETQTVLSSVRGASLPSPISFAGPTENVGSTRRLPELQASLQFFQGENETLRAKCQKQEELLRMTPDRSISKLQAQLLALKNENKCLLKQAHAAGSRTTPRDSSDASGSNIVGIQPGEGSQLQFGSQTYESLEGLRELKKKLDELQQALAVEREKTATKNASAEENMSQLLEEKMRLQLEFAEKSVDDEGDRMYSSNSPSLASCFGSKVIQGAETLQQLIATMKRREEEQEARVRAVEQRLEDVVTLLGSEKESSELMKRELCDTRRKLQEMEMRAMLAENRAEDDRGLRTPGVHNLYDVDYAPQQGMNASLGLGQAATNQMPFCGTAQTTQLNELPVQRLWEDLAYLNLVNVRLGSFMGF